MAIVVTGKNPPCSSSTIKTQTSGDGFQPRDNFIWRGIRLITERKRPSGRQGQRNGLAKGTDNGKADRRVQLQQRNLRLRFLHRLGRDQSRNRPTLIFESMVNDGRPGTTPLWHSAVPRRDNSNLARGFQPGAPQFHSG